MAIKAGSILHVGNDTVVIDRIQTGGPGNLNIPTEKIYEVGNYESVATIRDVPDLTFNLESFDTSTEIEDLLTGGTTGSPAYYDLAAAQSVDVASQWKPGKDAASPFDIVAGVGLPYLVLESMQYRFGLRDNARQTASLRGDSIFYCPGAVFVEDVAGDGTPGQDVVTTHPAYAYTDSTGTRRVLSVCVNNRRLTPGVDYTLADGTITAGAAIVTITLVDAVDVAETVRVMYSSPDTRTYDQTVHADPAVKPAAIRGKDIDVYIDGYDPTDIPGSQANKWISVQAVTVDWRVTLEKDEEFGNYFAVANDYDVPTVNGTVDVKPRDPDEFFAKVRQISGVSGADEVVGPNNAVALPLDVVVKNPADGATLKRLHVPDARFSVPGYSAQVQQKLTVTLNFESDGGVLHVFDD